MANIFDKAKKLANKLSDEMNKGKWDTNTVNTALFNYEDPYKAKPAGGGGASDVKAVSEQTPPSAITMAAPVPEPIGAAGAKEVSPAVAEAAKAAAEAGYVKPVFKSRFSGTGYSTAKVPNKDGLNSLSDLPVVDRSQSISGIKEITIDDLNENRAAAPAPAVPAAEIPAPVPAIAVQQAVPVPVPAVAVAEIPAPAPAVTVQQAVPVPAAPVVEEPVPAVAETVQESCYYVLITHTKTYPAVGSRVLMRSCDHEYVWTNQLSEDQKPVFDRCPNCGRMVGYTETEMD